MGEISFRGERSAQPGSVRMNGRLAAELRRAGRPMQQIDIQTASIAGVLGQCSVVSDDADVLVVPGLHVENWAS